VIQRAHLIPKQRLKAAGLSHDEIWDLRVWVPACERHHHQFDKGFIRLGVDDYPQELLEYAWHHDFGWEGERDGWRFHEASVARGTLGADG
jgi:hypothetical protein